MKKKMLSMFSMLFFCSLVMAQYQELLFSERVNESELILEGKIIDQYPFKKDGLIYTANQVEICAILYEEIQSFASYSGNDIYIVTHGGEMEGEFNQWSHLLNLNKGMEGLFFLKSNISLTPDNPLVNSSYYEVYGQEQGFIAYSKDSNWDFEANSLFEHITDMDAYIEDINLATTQPNITESCIVNNKSGLVIRLDTVIVEESEITARSSIKGQLSKSYKLNEVRLEVEFNTAVDLAQYNFGLNTTNSELQNNYTLAWSQLAPAVALIEITKNPSSTSYQEIFTDFVDFIEIKFHPALLSVTGLDNLNLSQASYEEGSEFFDFIEYDIVNNKFLQDFFASPNMKSFSPLEVCAGIKADNSSGTPALPGYVIISGDNFGNLSPSDFPNVIPKDYRVEFIREESIGTNSFKVTPLPEDYEYWTDNAIKVRVPTAGWLVNNSNILDADDPPVSKNAVTGRITVRNPDGSDSSPDDQNQKELVVKFAQFNSVDIAGTLHSKDRKLIAQSGNGGYYFVFDPSFDNIVIGSSALAAAKQDIIDAFCDWNMFTQAKLEVVETCPVNEPCFKISYGMIPTSGTSTIALAAGLSQPDQFACPNEAVVSAMQLIFSSSITDWKPSSQANPSIDDHIIKPTAFHEIGHLLQLGHVYNDDATMYPFYETSIIIDNDAIAGGSHVSQVSTNTNCTNPLVKSSIASCMTPLHDHWEEALVQLSPNPANDILELVWKDNLHKETFIEIYNNLGELMLTQNIQDTHSKIEINHLVGGQYTLLIKADQKIFRPLNFIKL